MAKMGTDFHFFGGSSGSLGGEGFSSSWWGRGEGGWISSVGGVPTGKNGSFFSTGVPARGGGWGVPAGSWRGGFHQGWVSAGVPAGGGWVSSHFPPRVGVGSDGQKGSNNGEKKVEPNGSKGIIRFI